METELARDVPVTEAERERQRRSFAYGNTNIENARITRATIDKAAERLEKTSPGTKSK